MPPLCRLARAALGLTLCLAALAVGGLLLPLTLALWARPFFSRRR